ncbi:elongation factor P hydroxylase [Planctobacterium marinum]|uniref:elongation factor P hydroxylase n=1 Tax=Planctobacterium marinum TaxID=1631968 RepID=UPI001E3982C3|nr:elongation factor P hydroxylase [Planctobacterium marinum]MCC2605906.1 elongation factor P hydroxylase [Planctobacterium marinum]
MVQEHCYQDLIGIFNQCFASYNTRLVKGDGEPVYLPADDACAWHRIEFAHGYFSSGLHEIAHWCIAGEQRRQLVDYGYWYCPDGRNQEQQAAFEKVEVKPQALEWCFSVACGLKFRVSTDNLNGAPVDRFAFQDKVLHQVEFYLQQGLPARANAGAGHAGVLPNAVATFILISPGASLRCRSLMFYPGLTLPESFA